MRPLLNKLVSVGTTSTETDSLLVPEELTAFNMTVYVLSFVNGDTPSKESADILTGLYICGGSNGTKVAPLSVEYW